MQCPVSEEEASEAGASAAEHAQWRSQDQLLARLPVALVEAFKQTELDFYKHCKVAHHPDVATLTYKLQLMGVWGRVMKGFAGGDGKCKDFYRLTLNQEIYAEIKWIQ